MMWMSTRSPRSYSLKIALFFNTPFAVISSTDLRKNEFLLKLPLFLFYLLLLLICTSYLNVLKL